MKSMKLFLLLVLGLTVNDVESAMEENPGMFTLETQFGKKIVHADLNDVAKARIKSAINGNDGKIKASFQVTIGDFTADMRIDMAGEVGRGGQHAGARVPHAQISPFTMLKMVKVKGGGDATEERRVPFTPSFDAIELTSEMVTDTISENGKLARIGAGKALYQAIASTISNAADGKGWGIKLFPTDDLMPVIDFLGFTSGQ